MQTPASASASASDPAPKTKHAGERCVTIWIPKSLADELDTHLARQVAGLVGVRPSRQAFLVALVRRALAAEGPR